MNQIIISRDATFENQKSNKEPNNQTLTNNKDADRHKKKPSEMKHYIAQRI